MSDLMPVSPGDRVEIKEDQIHMEMIGKSGTVTQIGKGFVKIRLDSGGSYCTAEDNVIFERMKKE